jgi:hypothetical protein
MSCLLVDVIGNGATKFEMSGVKGEKEYLTVVTATQPTPTGEGQMPDRVPVEVTDRNSTHTPVGPVGVEGLATVPAEHPVALASIPSPVACCAACVRIVATV